MGELREVFFGDWNKKVYLINKLNTFKKFELMSYNSVTSLNLELTHPSNKSTLCT